MTKFEQKLLEIVNSYVDGEPRKMTEKGAIYYAEELREALAEDERSERFINFQRRLECPFAVKGTGDTIFGCSRYAGMVSECSGHCSWVVDYERNEEIIEKNKKL